MKDRDAPRHRFDPVEFEDKLENIGWIVIGIAGLVCVIVGIGALFAAGKI